MAELRKILIAIDDSAESLRALQWTIDNMYREGDILALLHVIPRPQATSSYGAPPVDMLPSSSVADQGQQALAAQEFIREKFLPRLQGCADDPELHIVRVRKPAPQAFFQQHIAWSSRKRLSTLCMQQTHMGMSNSSFASHGLYI